LSSFLSYFKQDRHNPVLLKVLSTYLKAKGIKLSYMFKFYRILMENNKSLNIQVDSRQEVLSGKVDQHVRDHRTGDGSSRVSLSNSSTLQMGSAQTSCISNSGGIQVPGWNLGQEDSSGLPESFKGSSVNGDYGSSSNSSLW
jgi:hypothetical protein